jgi:hypothetical protein
VARDSSEAGTSINATNSFGSVSPGLILKTLPRMIVPSFGDVMLSGKGPQELSSRSCSRSRKDYLPTRWASLFSFSPQINSIRSVSPISR